MEMNEYQALASRTRPQEDDLGQVANFSMGLCGEAGEVTDYLKKVIFHGHKMELEKLCSELGDVIWYVSQLADIYGLPLAHVASHNINKLKRRYPDGFKESDSINREV